MPSLGDNVYFAEVGMVGWGTFNMIALCFSLQIAIIYPLLAFVSSVHSTLGNSCQWKQEQIKVDNRL